MSLPFSVGPTLADALASASTAVQTVATFGLWAAWALVLLATLAWRPLSLTIVRIGAPASLAAAVAAAIADSPDALGVGFAALVTVLALSAQIGEIAVDGASYGNERRFPLRAPGPLLFGPVFITWAAVVASIAVGPLLLAARQWVAGASAVVVGAALAWFSGRALHALSRRWIVFVPAGFVVADAMTTLDPYLLRRHSFAIQAVPLARRLESTDAFDATQRALGSALELTLKEPISITPTVRGDTPSEIITVAAIRISPSRPSAVVAEATKRNFLAL